MPDFTKIAAPLHALLGGTDKKKPKRKNTDGCSESYDTAFSELKRRLVSAPVLGYPVFTKPFILKTDAVLQGYVPFCHSVRRIEMLC